MANLHSVNRGDEAVELPNYYDPGQRPLRISLDPTLSPQENAASYFRRYRKAKSGEDALQKQMAELEQKRESAHVLLTRVEAAQSMQEVELLRPEVERLAPLRAPHEAPAAHRGLRTAPAPKIQRIQAEGGWEILVGETKEANDYLTTKIASPDDLWFHVRAAASAHVVVRTGRRPQQVPREVIMQAARLAAAHSEAKHSSVVAVDYTLKRYVHKPRGSAPGAVIYRNEKTVHVEP
jgi:predicted ribosome quality control (RQC) complex YloA/Tae2 family protein